MRLIVGLGNPGARYAKNRHNVGFQCVELLAARHGLHFDLRKGNAHAALGQVRLVVSTQALPPSTRISRTIEPRPEPRAGAAPSPSPPVEEADPAPEQPLTVIRRLLVAKPQTMMNLAGRSVASLVHFYKVDLSDLLVIFDDLDLPLGKIRFRAAGGSGGHNGMRSIIGELGTTGFARLRIGIDRPPGRMDPADYVLQDFSPEQEDEMNAVRDHVVAACEHWLAFDIATAMNAFN